VPHPVHQFAGCRAGVGRKLVTGVPEFVEVKSGGQPRRCHDHLPLGAPAEVPSAQDGALFAPEHQILGARSRITLDMSAQLIDQHVLVTPVLWMLLNLYFDY
jgi:hypothetical protein